jgi:Tol biopolymer transport system component
MKGQTFTFTPTKMEDKGISPNVIRLTDERYTCNHMYFHNRSFTPDDKFVIFQSMMHGTNNLYKLELATNTVTKLTHGYDIDYFGYPSRDGKKVYFGVAGCIRTVDLDTCEEEVILRAQDLVKENVTKCSGAFPSWDGKKLVCFYEAMPDFGLIVLDLVTGDKKIIIHGDQPLRHCQFCPNDHNLIMYAHEGSRAVVKSRMWLINADGSNNRRVRSVDDGEFASAGHAGHEFWANIGRRIYYTVRLEGKLYFSTIDLDTGKEETLFELDNEHGTITQDDKYVITDSSRGNGEMNIVNLATKEKKVLCYHNFSWSGAEMSRLHPHPTVSYNTRKCIYTTDGFGPKPGVFVADIPYF